MTADTGDGEGAQEEESKDSDERVQEIRREREGLEFDPSTGGASVAEGTELDTSGVIEPHVSAPGFIGSSKDPDYPSPILVCVDCRAYYEYDDDWEVCPQCGEELTEVDKA